MNKIWAIGILAVLATGIALWSSPLYHAYHTVLDANEVDDGPGWCAKALDNPSDTVFRGYLTGVMENYRSGQSDCQGGTGDWGNTVCLQNAIIRWSGESQFVPAFEDDLEQCYWHWCELLSTEYCYPDWDNGSQNDPVYYAFIGNDDRKFYHAVCAEHEGGNMSDFDNWRFFQYRDNDTVPGDWQMPCGTDTGDTYVLVQRTDDVWCSGIDATPVYSWNIDKNCNVSSREVPSAHVTDEDVTLMKSRIEELKEVPEMQISATAIHRVEKTVVLWVYEGTPENERLHRKMIGEWGIIVAKPNEPPKTIIFVLVAILLSISFLVVFAITLRRRKARRN
jgi:hypothetical protein